MGFIPNMMTSSNTKTTDGFVNINIYFLYEVIQINNDGKIIVVIRFFIVDL